MESLAARKNERVYEPLETSLLLKTVSDLTNPIILDIGANIGLMSLNLCYFNQKLKVFAFEPGFRQFGYLQQNIERNGLGERISYQNIALGDKDGVSKFHIHDTEHSSGDGFLDTGRAGKYQVIDVKTQTLDSWWTINGTPAVTTVKLDTEGSELTILKHSHTLIEKCRPSILIEIAEENFRQYSIDFSDYLEFLKSIRYVLVDITAGSLVSEASQFKKDHTYFMAIPSEKSENSDNYRISEFLS